MESIQDAAIEHVAPVIGAWVAEGRRVALARVAAIQGFSTWSASQLVALDAEGQVVGELLGTAGLDQLRASAASLLAETSSPDDVVLASVEVAGAAVGEAGLSCGGRAEILLQRADALPPSLWDLLAGRESVALATVLRGPGAGQNLLVGANGALSGADAVAGAGAVVAEALDLLASGHSGLRQLEEALGSVLVEAWVPAPRLVVVGRGDLVGHLRAQAGLLGWELGAGESPGELDALFDWAGASAAVVVLSHDPAIDTPALIAALAGPAAYVGALGSRRTQAARAERLREAGLADAEITRVRGPIGLDLGGRSGPEVALSICAEIQALRCGRSAVGLKQASGSITGRIGR